MQKTGLSDGKSRVNKSWSSLVFLNQVSVTRKYKLFSPTGLVAINNSVQTFNTYYTIGERFLNVHELLHRLSGVVNRVQYSWEK